MYQKPQRSLFWWEEEQESESYNYNFGRRFDEQAADTSRIPDTPAGKLLKEVVEDYEKKQKKEWWEREWYEYEKTGIWHGYSYYRTPKLDYSYVEKMANAFASKYHVDVEVGIKWAVDLKTKKLTYNPTDLIYGTKTDLIASLLHEIGHLAHTTNYPGLRSKYLTKYGESGAKDTLNAYEDVRIDCIMAKSYEGAGDIFKANRAGVKKIGEDYIKKSQNKKRFALDQLELLRGNSSTENLQRLFGTTDHGEILKRIKELETQLVQKTLLWDFLAYSLFYAYEQKKLLEQATPDLKQRLDKTVGVFQPVKKAKNTQTVLVNLDQKVFPVIEDLLKEEVDGMKEIAQAFSPELAKLLADEYRTGETVDQWGQDFLPARSSGEGSGVPSSWKSGNYGPLYDSVKTAVESLVRKLTFLRREEQTIKYRENEKRGRLSSRTLYRFALNNYRVFKRKQETRDTVKSFAFSLLLDTSGSMSGDKIAQAVRGVILLAETMSRMSIPFEILTFDRDTKLVKTFEEEYGKSAKTKLAGQATSNYLGGSTNLYKAFQNRRWNNEKPTVSLRDRPEQNKVCVIISDGGVGGKDYQTYFREEEKRKILHLGVGIECGNQIVELCNGKGVSVSNVAQLPDEFSQLLKRLITRPKQ